MSNVVRLIPPIHELLQSKTLKHLVDEHNLNEPFVKRVIQQQTDQTRKDILSKELTFESREEVRDYILSNTKDSIESYMSNQIEPVINATGTVLHTNLGRARLSEAAIQRVVEVARHYSTLEYNKQTGDRGSRHDLVEQYIKDLTGAEAAIVVNNNAASVYMVLSAFSKGGEVIVSRGELVEIGGSFRVSSIMEESGATLKEVGTTNKTHLYDYEQAINEHTSMMMKVHTSNFHMIGFTKQVERTDLVKLAREHDVLIYEDLGSGMVYDLTEHGIGQEPLVRDIIESGIDLVSFSGDKLLGGPQVGVIAGKKEYINQLKKHQLARVLRVDKMTYAALEETLKQWIFINQNKNIPTLRDILLTREELKIRVKRFIERYLTYDDTSLVLNEKILSSKIGGGTLPEINLDSYGVTINSEQYTSKELKDLLRKMNPPIITRIEDEQVLMDFRTISENEEDIVLKKLVEIK
mgnify:CR=1 FL=1